jgi:hypothetical protein
MRLFRLVAALAFASALTGCNAYDATLPDGGRGRVNCTDDAVKVPVTLLDRSGQPTSNGGVVATYLSTGEEVVFPTNGSGVAVVTDKGPGIVRVVGQLNDLTTAPAELTFTGGECSNAVSPRSVTLQLK